VNNATLTPAIPSNCRGSAFGHPQGFPLGFLKALVAWDSVLFACICLLDMLSTIYFVQSGGATEANPVLAGTFRYGIWCFVLAKLCSFMPALVVAAYFRDRYPSFIGVCLRGAMIAYAIIYAIGVGRQF
jgi:hypothetical protein